MKDDLQKVENDKLNSPVQGEFIITPALADATVGGLKLAYAIGKDAIVKLKSECPLIVIFQDSTSPIDNTDLFRILFNIQNITMHSIYLENIIIDKIKKYEITNKSLETVIKVGPRLDLPAQYNLAKQFLPVKIEAYKSTGIEISFLESNLGTVTSKSPWLNIQLRYSELHEKKEKFTNKITARIRGLRR